MLGYTDTGDAVYDPFTGSGTSIAAAHLLRRVGYGVELSPGYCDVALGRLTDLTQEAPVLQESGQRFAEVAKARGVPIEETAKPKQQGPRGVRQNRPAPGNANRKKAS